MNLFEITAEEAMELIIADKSERLYFQRCEKGRLYPLDGNPIYAHAMSKVKWFKVCEDTGVSIQEAMLFAIERYTGGKLHIACIDDIATDYIKTLKERETSE